MKAFKVENDIARQAFVLFICTFLSNSIWSG